eukprot:7378991-Prymnesium_polylepis.1
MKALWEAQPDGNNTKTYIRVLSELGVRQQLSLCWCAVPYAKHTPDCCASARELYPAYQPSGRPGCMVGNGAEAGAQQERGRGAAGRAAERGCAVEAELSGPVRSC